MRMIASKADIDPITNRQKEITLIADNAAEEIMITEIRDALRNGTWDRWTLLLTNGDEMVVDFPYGTQPQPSGDAG